METAHLSLAESKNSRALNWAMDVPIREHSNPTAIEIGNSRAMPEAMRFLLASDAVVVQTMKKHGTVMIAVTNEITETKSSSVTI